MPPGFDLASLQAKIMSPTGIAKLLASTIMGLLGMYYLNAGRKEQDVDAMIKGAVLTLLSMFLF